MPRITVAPGSSASQPAVRATGPEYEESVPVWALSAVLGDRPTRTVDSCPSEPAMRPRRFGPRGPNCSSPEDFFRRFGRWWRPVIQICDAARRESIRDEFCGSLVLNLGVPKF